MKENKSQKALDRLAQALVDDILSMSDDALMCEIAEDGLDPAAEAARLRGIYATALGAVGRARLAAAKAAVAADKAIPRQGAVVKLDPATNRARLEAVLRRDPETLDKLTLAARNGEGLSDSDVQSMLEDLEALGLLPPNDEENGRS